MLAYAPDFDEGVEDKERIEAQRQEFQEMFRMETEQQEKKAEGTKKEALKMVKAQTDIMNELKNKINASLDREQKYKEQLEEL